MFKFMTFGSICLLLLTTMHFTGHTGVHAEEDEVEDEVMDGEAEDDEDSDEGIVEEEDDDSSDESDLSSTEEVEASEVEQITSHKDVNTAILFNTGIEPSLWAGKRAKSFIHFSNGGSNNFIIMSIDASFRYPQDFSYIIQNFTSHTPNKMVDAGKEGSFKYEFTPGELAGGRSFGLAINVNYKDVEGNLYKDSVYNQTIQVLENEDGVDAETFFMYLMLLGFGLLILLGIYQTASSKSKRPKRAQQQAVPQMNGTMETGTGAVNGPVDFKWIPQETLQMLQKKSPSPRSPRRRAAKKAAAAAAAAE